MGKVLFTYPHNVRVDPFHYHDGHGGHDDRVLRAAQGGRGPIQSRRGRVHPCGDHPSGDRVRHHVRHDALHRRVEPYVRRGTF